MSKTKIKGSKKLELLQRLWDEYTAMVSIIESSIDFIDSDEDADILSDAIRDTEDMERLRIELSAAGVKNIAGIF